MALTSRPAAHAKAKETIPALGPAEADWLVVAVCTLSRLLADRIFQHFCREQGSHHLLMHDNATLKMHPIALVVFGHHFSFAFSAGPRFCLAGWPENRECPRQLSWKPLYVHRLLRNPGNQPERQLGNDKTDISLSCFALPSRQSGLRRSTPLPRNRGGPQYAQRSGQTRAVRYSA